MRVMRTWVWRGLLLDMNVNVGAQVSRFRWGRAVAAAVAAGALLVGCGSDGDGSASAPTVKAKAPAGAKENATTAPVCFDLYKPTVQVGCAENTIGPGGGVIFYNAGGPQAWGQFLEVAPQKWNGALYACTASSCGSNSSLGVEAKTSDGGPNANGDITQPGAGYRACGADSKWNMATWENTLDYKLPGAAANLPSTVGSGRSNTATLLATPSCVNGQTDAVSLAAGYRGGGLTDWFLPSLDELKKLCVFGNRNSIGGFVVADARRYASSTTSTGTYTGFLGLTMGGGCDAANQQFGRQGATLDKAGYVSRSVRPIRAF